MARPSGVAVLGAPRLGQLGMTPPREWTRMEHTDPLQSNVCALRHGDNRSGINAMNYALTAEWLQRREARRPPAVQARTPA
jgi:hypothetical protein